MLTISTVNVVVVSICRSIAFSETWAKLRFLCNKMHVCAEMPAKLVDVPLALFELVVITTMFRFQKIDQLSLAVRFVDIDGTIQDEFVGYRSLERITGEAISSTILEVLPKWNLNIKGLFTRCDLSCRFVGPEKSWSKSTGVNGDPMRAISVRHVGRFGNIGCKITPLYAPNMFLSCSYTLEHVVRTSYAVEILS